MKASHFYIHDSHETKSMLGHILQSLHAFKYKLQWLYILSGLENKVCIFSNQFVEQADIKRANGALRPSFFVRPKIWKSTAICWNNKAECKGMGLRTSLQIDVGLTDLVLDSQNEARPHKIRSGLTMWGLASQCEVWPHRIWPSSKN